MLTCAHTSFTSINFSLSFATSHPARAVRQNAERLSAVVWCGWSVTAILTAQLSLLTDPAVDPNEPAALNICHLAKLPPELHVHIAGFLPLKSLARLAATNRYFKEITPVWRTFKDLARVESSLQLHHQKAKDLIDAVEWNAPWIQPSDRIFAQQWKTRIAQGTRFRACYKCMLILPVQQFELQMSHASRPGDWKEEGDPLQYCCNVMHLKRDQRCSNIRLCMQCQRNTWSAADLFGPGKQIMSIGQEWIGCVSCGELTAFHPSGNSLCHDCDATLPKSKVVELAERLRKVMGKGKVKGRRFLRRWKNK